MSVEQNMRLRVILILIYLGVFLGIGGFFVYRAVNDPSSLTDALPSITPQPASVPIVPMLPTTSDTSSAALPAVVPFTPLSSE